MIVIGHRGARGIRPENTLSSFKEALKYVKAVELDVYICKTGEVVVIHDDTVDRTTNGHGRVEEMTFEDLKKLDQGMGERIPTLREVLDLINKRAIVSIELKGKGTASAIKDIISEYLSKGWKEENFAVSSFDHEELEKFHHLCHSIRTGVLIEDDESDYIGIAKRINAFSINPPLKMVDEGFIKRVHESGFKVFVWTVNEKKDAERLKQFGVDGIITDYPNKF
ncbi:MAG: glycerophosphodiester phosphodiesterase family protein [Candidatus Pacebacteria bacterium]|nr:glycerophosphodiester phosphodiesterase family protein [Candidatus Paceibacterota bacterium]